MKMIKKTTAVLASIAAVVAMTACSSDSSSSGGGGGGTATLATGGFIKEVGASTASGYYDINTAITSGRFQSLYTASDMNGSGYITSFDITYYTDEATDITCTDEVIKMGHTSLTDLTTSLDTNVEEGKGSFATVATIATHTLPAGNSGTKYTYTLDTPFYYNGVDNLVVEFERGAACDGTLGKATSTTSTSSMAVVYNTTFTTTYLMQMDMDFSFSGGDDKVYYLGDILDSAPLNTNTSWQHMQMLHLASDINGSGPITGIALVSPEAPTDVAHYRINLSLAHTTLLELTDTFADNLNSGPAVVVDENVSFTVPAGIPAGTPIWLPLQGSFIYNGTDNLIVDIEVLEADTVTQLKRDGTTHPNSRVYGVIGAPTGYLNSGSYDTVFRFNGGTTDVITNGGSSTGWLFPSPSNTTRQALYRASELGTAGTISKVACRMSSATSVETLYPNYKVTMGHTTLDQLTATYADNFDDASVVYDGNYTVPAGLVQGDWIEIPISPFNYDGKRNLVIQFASDAGAGAHSCRLSSSDAIKYPAQLNGNIDRTAITASQIVDNKMDTRLWVQP